RRRLGSERSAPYDAHCAWHVLLAGRGPGRLPFAGGLAHLLVGGARLDRRDPTLPSLHSRHPLHPRTSVRAVCYSAAYATVSPADDHGGDVRLVERVRLAVSLAGGNHEYRAVVLPYGLSPHPVDLELACDRPRDGHLWHVDDPGA